MTAPYGQPEPFEMQPITQPVPRPKTPSSRALIPILAAVLLAAVAFAGGFVVANATSTKTVAGAGAGANGANGNDGQGVGPGSSFRPRNGFGGGASGTVGTVSADQMTINTQANGQRIVLLTPTTTVTQVTSATKAVSDITTGETVTVIGTSNPDGSVTATQVIIGNAGIFGGRGGFGGGRDPNASPAPSSAP